MRNMSKLLASSRESRQAESVLAARPTRMIVALLAFISRATALIEAPSANRCNVSSRCLSDSAARRPNFIPSALARACPNSVRSISKSYGARTCGGELIVRHRRAIAEPPNKHPGPHDVQRCQAFLK
jgi:hypothetical protein